MFLPSKISKYFLIEFIKIFLLILFSISILVFIVDFLEFLPKIDKYAIPSFIAIKIILYRIPNMIEEFLEFMILLSVVFTMTKIASKSELTVIYSSGYSSWKILKIYSIFIFFLGIFNICCMDLVSTNLVKQSTILENKYTKNEKKYFVRSRNGLWLKQINPDNKKDEIIIRAEKVYLEDLVFKDCILEFLDSGNFKKRYNVGSIKLENGFWNLRNIYIFAEDKKLDFQEELKIPTNISQDFMKQQIQNRYENLDLIPLFSLNKLIKEFKISGLDTNKFIVKKHILILTPFIYVLMIFFGLLFSDNNQRNTKNIVNIFKALICGICIFVIQNTLFELALANKINVFFATWGFVILLFITSCFFLIKKIELQNC